MFSWWYVTASGQYIAQFYSDSQSMQAIVGAIKRFPGVATGSVKVYSFVNGAWTELGNIPNV